MNPSKPLDWREFVDPSDFYNRRGKSLQSAHIQTVQVLPPVVSCEDLPEHVLLSPTLSILAREERWLGEVGERLQIEGEE